MKITVNEKIDKNLWNRLVGYKIFYRFEWFYIIQNSYSLKPYFILTQKADKFALIGSFLTSKGYISMPFLSYSGFYYNDIDVLDKLKSYLSKNSINIDARNLIEQNNLEGYVNPIATFETEDEFWKKIQPRFRTLLRKSLKSNLYFTVEDSIKNFYNLYSIGMRNLGTPVHSKSYIEEITKYIPWKVFTIFDGKKPIGSMFCLKDNDTLAVLYAYTLPEYSKRYANYFLYLNVVEWMLANGLQNFDMGRSTYNEGTYFFKKKFRPKIYQINSNINYSQNKKLKIASNIWKNLPLGIANFIGPKIRKFLP